MNNKNSLIIGRGIFTIFVVIFLGLIIMNEKGGEIFSPKIEKEINAYLVENYSNIKNSIKQDSIKYTNKKFEVKVESIKNKNHFFNITYRQGKITDTYKEDYKEGKNILTYIEKELEKQIENETGVICKVHSISSLDEYTEKLQEAILNEDNLLELKFYYIEKDLTINNWTSKDITNEIVNIIKTLNDKNIKPKYYKIIITKEDDITTSIEISNLTEEFILNKNNTLIIDSILKDNNPNLIKDNKITYKYLN